MPKRPTKKNIRKADRKKVTKKPYRRPSKKTVKQATRKTSLFHRHVAHDKVAHGKVAQGGAVGDTSNKDSSNEQIRGEHRLQKILASAGFGSRRQCEELIEQGRVEVNGQIAALGHKVNPRNAVIKVDGERLKLAKPVYLALFKPKGYLCTDYDQQGRSRAIELVPESFGRLFLVGRLDKDSDGLILLTNDGSLSERLTHPRFGVPKVYRVQVAGEITEEAVQQLRKGVYLAEGFAKAENVIIKGRHKQSSILEMTLAEGMNREIRRLLARIGHKVMSLTRVAVGHVKLGKMLPGEWRKLTLAEVERLYATGKR